MPTETLLLGNVTGKEISVIKDPFQKNCIGDMSIRRTSWGNKFYWYATVEFKNGSTKGEQKTPDCETFEEVIAHVKQILNSVNQ
jgi:hypothetical protein